MTELFKLCSPEMYCEIINEIIDFMGIDIENLTDGKQGK